MSSSNKNNSYNKTPSNLILKERHHLHRYHQHHIKMIVVVTYTSAFITLGIVIFGVVGSNRSEIYTYNYIYTKFIYINYIQSHYGMNKLKGHQNGVSEVNFSVKFTNSHLKYHETQSQPLF